MAVGHAASRRASRRRQRRRRAAPTARCAPTTSAGRSSSPGRRSISSSTPRPSRSRCRARSGTPARNMIIGPGSKLLNAQISRDVTMKRNRAVTIQATATNLLNAVNYAAIDTVVNSPTFGQVLSVRADALGAAQLPVPVLGFDVRETGVPDKAGGWPAFDRPARSRHRPDRRRPVAHTDRRNRRRAAKETDVSRQHADRLGRRHRPRRVGRDRQGADGRRTSRSPRTARPQAISSFTFEEISEHPRGSRPPICSRRRKPGWPTTRGTRSRPRRCQRAAAEASDR